MLKIPVCPLWSTLLYFPFIVFCPLTEQMGRTGGRTDGWKGRREKKEEKEGGRMGEKEARMEKRREGGRKGQRERHKRRTAGQMDGKGEEREEEGKEGKKKGRECGRKGRKERMNEKRKKACPHSFSTSSPAHPHTCTTSEPPPPPPLHFQETAFQVAILASPSDMGEVPTEPKDWENTPVSLPHGSAQSPAALGQRAAATPPSPSRARGGKGGGAGALPRPNRAPRTCRGAAGSSALPPHPLAAGTGTVTGTVTAPQAPLPFPSGHQRIFFPFTVTVIIFIIFKATLPQTPPWASPASTAILTWLRSPLCPCCSCL